jgi:hypothetical protein
MIIIWRGRGLVALAVPFFMLLGVEILVSLVFGVGAWMANVGGLVTLVFLASAGVLFWLDRRWREPGRLLVDPATGHKVILRRDHALFFVPLRYWSVVMLVGAAIALVQGARYGTI